MKRSELLSRSSPYKETYYYIICIEIEITESESIKKILFLELIINLHIVNVSVYSLLPKTQVGPLSTFLESTGETGTI